MTQALPPPLAPARLPLAGSAAVHQRLLLTLLFLGVVGLPRTWDLRGYTADGLALLTGRTRAYGYRYTEAFSEVGTFVPLNTDSHGQVIREVAPARISLLREDHPDDSLCLQVALIRDLRRRVLVPLTQRKCSTRRAGTKTCHLMNGPGGVRAGEPQRFRPKR